MTNNQSKMLTALLDGELNRTNLRTKSGVYGTTATFCIGTLIKLGWIDEEPVYGEKTKIISITFAGKQALKRHAMGLDKQEGDVVPPNKINRMSGFYLPPRIFLRNDSNKHVLSYGLGC